MSKTAVILLNMGGPDSLEAVKPFLFNLFNDKAIIGVPQPIRFLLAKYISSKREKKAQGIYSKIGGKSPLLEKTKDQAKALEAKLGDEYKVFIVMRYWHPFASETVEKVKKYNPDKVILLPLYPQSSLATTYSSIDDWRKISCKNGLFVNDDEVIYSYHLNKKFIAAHVETIRPYYDLAKKYGDPMILFSAHGLPEKFIEKGDVYKDQVEESSQAIVNKMNIDKLDWKVCYQSRLGPAKWIEPYTEDEIISAAKAGKPIVIVPVSFVSDHSETLVELGIEYRKLAEENGTENYFVVPALGANMLFIEAMASIVT